MVTVSSTTRCMPLPGVTSCSSRKWPRRSAMAVGILAVLTASVSRAESPSITFDVHSTTVCRDVTPVGFSAAYPGQKLVEARFQVSSLIRDGNEQQIAQYLYRFASPNQSFAVVDYLPKTTLVSNVAGNVDVETRVESGSSIGISAAGHYAPLPSVDASAAKNAKRSSNVQFELLPKQELVAASGTMARASGAYFKLKPSGQFALEGAKDFALVLRVPIGWRADCIHLTCEAKLWKHSVLRAPRDNTISLNDRFEIALFAEGDREAQATAAEFVRSQKRLLQVAQDYDSEIRTRRYANAAHEVGASLSLARPRIPSNWLKQVVYGGASVRELRFSRYLPQPVQDAVTDYLSWKNQLRQHNGSATRHLASIH